VSERLISIFRNLGIEEFRNYGIENSEVEEIGALDLKKIKLASIKSKSRKL